MRVGLNATCFNERPSGANQRFAGIYGALIRRCPDVKFVIYEPADCRVGDWFEGAANVTVRRTPLSSTSRGRRALRGLTYWPRAFSRDRLDLFETFHLPLVRARRCPTIMTIHDARPVRADVPPMKRLLSGAILRYALRRADHVVTVSQTMRREILAIEPSASVGVIYNGIDPALFDCVDQRSAEENRRSLGLPPNYLLAVGHLEDRKNYVRLVQAVAKLRGGGRPLSLVIVGNEGGHEGVIAEEIRWLGLQDHVKILQGVTNRELAEIYSLSTLVVFPSYYEGFGIPILEAMAARRPLVLSDIPVFRELTEEKGAYFPPADIEAMAATIEHLLSDSQRQRELVVYGANRIRSFAFPELAAQVEQVYRTLT